MIKQIVALLKLMRWPNLLFVLLTQFLFWYFVLPYAYGTDSTEFNARLTGPLFFYLTLASVCIAAAGYIINDYYDVEIDRVNKCSRVIIGSEISKKAAIFLHAGFSITGIFLSWYVSYKLQNYYILFFNFLSIILLLLYSVRLKKRLLIGNILISNLTAWVILVLTLAEYPLGFSDLNTSWPRIWWFSILYSGFAWIISLIREVVKDIEDLEGDARFGCTTLPITGGVRVTKIFAGAWLVVLALLIMGMIWYGVQAGWLGLVFYALIAILLPVLLALQQLYKATTVGQYHRLSRLLKIIMLTGILSMIFFNTPS